jgi:DNA-binding protein HU-beta
MNKMKPAVEIEIDLETDDLLNRIAQCDDKVEPDLLRAIIPKRDEFLRYLEEHKLTDYPIAQHVLAQLDALAPMPKKGLTKTDLVRLLAEKLETTNKTAGLFLTTLAEIAVRETRKNDVFVLPGLGRLKRSARKARIGRNPQTGESIKIPEKSTVKFRLSKGAKDAIVAKKNK